MKRFLTAVIVLSFFAAPLGVRAAAPSTPAQQLMSKLQWRSIGPYIGGRAVAVAGVPSNPNLFYFGGVQAGVWKSTNYGLSWTNITDGKIPGIADPIGALAVAPSNPSVIYAGTGEADIRSDFDTGDGIYKTTDAGKTWSYAGLRETHMIAKLVIDPHDPKIVYAASMGHVFKPNADRGIFKTTDGGATWKKVLFVDDKTGGIDLVMDSRNASVLYAAMWQAQRQPWKLTSGGPGSGLYKTADGGAHWTKISANPGYATGILGKIGVAVAASDPRVVYSIAQARDGGVFRSNDGGATWKRVNAEWKLRQRAFYYTAIFVDPTNSQVVFAPEVDAVYKSKNGGKTWSQVNPPHGDNHIVWINPRNPKIILVGDDGGASVSVDGGETFSDDHNQPTGQFYHVAIDNQFPFHVFGASQDEGAYEGPSAEVGPGIGPGSWNSVALGESTFVAPDPDDVYVTYGSGYYSSFVKLNRITGDAKNVSPWPRYMAGHPSGDTKYRFGWTHPIFFSPANPHELLVAAQVVFSSPDRGQTWKIISPDLTRNDPTTEATSGGPIYPDQTGAETFPDISSLAVSPLDANVLWAGSADGLVHVTSDHGGNWTAVTPPQLPQWAQISSIEPSHTSKGTAYLTASRYMWDDYHPYVYETTDYGAHWTTLTNGLPADQYAFVVRQDPREPRLLFAGTRSTVYVSLDGGAQWQPLTSNLPGVQVRDLAVDPREGELVAATHGRAFWIMDNLALLEQLARQTAFTTASAQLFAPETAWLSNAYGGPTFFSLPNFGENPKYGAAVFFNLPAGYNGTTPATLSFLDAGGATVRSFTLHLKSKHERKLTPEQEEKLDANQERQRDVERLTAAQPGMNTLQWDLKYPPAYDYAGFKAVPTDDFADTGDGPTVVPGTYTVVLQYGSQRLQTSVRVELDPRIHPASGDLQARLALEMEIFRSIDALDRAIAAALSTRQHLSPAKRSQLDDEIASLTLLGVTSSEYDVVRPTQIREQLGFLMNSLEGAYARPTAAEYAAAKDLEALAAAGETRLQSIASY
ncbi:MAG: glycosyl hydrolase [Candidatus Eremiobacteraeota bacterium]|nr:glycosyl hydrolase [Candidatus Eremiobacteraeota bacterium]